MVVMSESMDQHCQSQNQPTGESQPEREQSKSLPERDSRHTAHIRHYGIPQNHYNTGSGSS